MEKIIRDIIAKGEIITTEFKTAQGGLPKSMFETVCAFLNRFGGIIILGIDEKNKSILGINPDYIDKYKTEFSNHCNNPQIVTPTVYLTLEDIEIDGKTLLYVKVPDSSEVHRNKGKIFDRNHQGDFDITNSTGLVTQMYFRKHKVHIEDNVNYNAHCIEDLNPETIAKARRLAINRDKKHPWKDLSDIDLLKSVKLYKKDEITGIEGITVAGILLFGTDLAVSHVCSHHKTDAIFRLEDLDRYDDRDDVRCNLIDSFDRLMSFIQKHTNDKFYLDEKTAITMSPRNIIAKEIISNILTHRNFSDTHPSRIIIYKDIMYADNPSIAFNYGFITIDNYNPQAKNPNIARVFKEIGYSDELGSGVRNLTKYTQAYSGTLPVMEDGIIFKTIIYLTKEGQKIKIAPSGFILDDPNGEEMAKSGEERVLDKLKDNPKITKQLLSHETGISSRTLDRIIKKLKDNGIIERIGSDTKGEWKIID